MNQYKNNERSIFSDAIELPLEERSAFVRKACGSNLELFQRVHDLLEAFCSGSLPLETVSLGTSEQVVITEGPGTTLGRYKLLQKIGEGGMGVVYMAEQTEPVHRKVALKIIKLGMDTKNVVARFEAERQALAMMDHPNIAKVLDGGATESGRPFFVMELVQGVPITKFCDANNATAEERIRLFIPVCQAIQSAHQKGIIHRDIKPSNVLVSQLHGEPIPKVIDFGIAKATNQKLTEKTLFTNYGSMIGTPAYMSPEQAEMSIIDIDTRTDVYSLGVLLYELLTGTTPFLSARLRSAGYREVQRIIVEEEPEKPSTRLSKSLEGRIQKAKTSSSDFRRHISKIDADLDWITMKCLDKDRRRRYETALDLASDLSRHLKNEPVIAAAPSALYRLQKALRRNKVIYSAVAAVFASLIFGFSISLWKTHVAKEAKIDAEAAEAEKEVQRLDAVSARVEETKIRVRAQKQELIAKRHAYASDLNLAQRALEVNNIGRARELLDRHRPESGEEDLRGWEWRYLWQFVQSEALESVTTLGGLVQMMAVSPDGSQLAIVSHNSMGLQLFDLPTLEPQRIIAADLRISVLAFHPEHPILVVDGIKENGDHVIRRITLGLDELPLDSPYDGGCVGLEFSPDGDVVVGGFIDRKEHWLAMWDFSKPANSMETIIRIDDSMNAILLRGFDLSPDGNSIALGTPNGEVQLIDIHNRKQKWSARATSDVVNVVAFSPDSKIVASAACCGDSDIILWDVESGQAAGKLSGHRAWVSSLVFSSDGKRLFSGSADRTIRIWDLAQSKQLGVLHGHEQEIWSLIGLTGTEHLISGAKDGAIMVWDPSLAAVQETKSKFRLEIEPRVLRMGYRPWTFADEGANIVTLSDEGEVALRRGPHFEKKKHLFQVPPSRNFGKFTKDGKRLLAEKDGRRELQVWDLDTQLLVSNIKVPNRQFRFASFADGGRLVVTVDDTGTASSWSTANGIRVTTWSLPSADAFMLTPHDGTRFYWMEQSDSKDFESFYLISRDLMNGQTLRSPSSSGPPIGFAVSPTGQQIAMPLQPGLTRVLDATTLIETQVLKGHLISEKAVTFSPDGRRLATAGQEYEAVKLWDWELGDELITLGSDPPYAFTVRFSSDHRSLGVRDLDGYVHVWRAATWDEIAAAEIDVASGLPE